MPAFAPEATIRPPRVIVVPFTAFADGWKGKPKDDVAMGLRRLSEADTQSARAEADQLSRELHDHPGEERDAAFNDALMRWAVARATTDPNDVHQPFFDMAEDTVREALTSHGVRRIYEELERLTIATSPLHPIATDEDLRELVARLSDAATLDQLTTGQARQLRRLLRHCLDELRLITGSPTFQHADARYCGKVLPQVRADPALRELREARG
jgi:hypothetical protein